MKRFLKRFCPRSLFARLVLIWLIGIFLVLAVSITVFVNERERVGREALFAGIAQEMASAADILDSIAPEERRRALNENVRRRLRLSLRGLPGHVEPTPEAAPSLLSALRLAMPERQPALYIHHHEDDDETRKNDWLIIAVQLADEAILTARLPIQILSPPGFASFAAAPFGSVLLSTLLALLAGIILLTWIGVRIATRPLSKLSEAALALGEDPERPPLELVGPTEVIQATNAFNQMQKRLAEHIHERTRILAAISHDLQTPITRLRLRAEMVEDEHLKTRIQSDLDAMQSLIREGLAYARSMEVTAPPQPIDLNALLAALCNDAVDMGWAVSVTGLASAPFVGQAVALRRALWNVIENGVKFGITVDITLSEAPDAFRIAIRDYGPGLPAKEIERVFEPFYRTESSRNRETGGTGLGLAITRNQLHVQRGSVNLHNHPEGGLVATVILPRR